jgi:hypothetical protein
MRSISSIIEEVSDMELIDEMKGHLPISAYASRDLSKLLIKNGMDITPEKESGQKA